MAMTTARDLIIGAMKAARIVGQGETPTAEEMNDGLDLLNMMLESWSLDRLFIYAEGQTIVSMQAAKADYTWGTGGDINSPRPIRLISAFTRDGAGVDYPAHILHTANEYDQIAVKGVPAPWPTEVWLEEGYPLATLHLYPTPSTTFSLYLRTYGVLQQFAALTDAIVLPPGYKEAALNNLAVRMAGHFGIEAPATVVATATHSVARLKRNNIHTGVAAIEAAGMNGNRPSFNIMAGE